MVDPSGDATELRLQLARLGTACTAILVTHGHWDHLVGVAELAEGTGAHGVHGGRRAISARGSEPLHAPGDHPASVHAGRPARRRRDDRGRRHRVRRPLGARATLPPISRSTRTDASSRATCCSQARSGAPTSRERTGTCCSRRSARSSTRLPADTVGVPRARSEDHTRGRARSQSVSRRAARGANGLTTKIERPRGTHDVVPESNRAGSW